MSLFFYLYIISSVLSSIFLSFLCDIVASSPDSKTKTDNIPGATSSSSIEREQKRPFIDKGLDTVAQRNQATLSTAAAAGGGAAQQQQQYHHHHQQLQQQQSAPPLNGLISSEFIRVVKLSTC